MSTERFTFTPRLLRQLKDDYARAREAGVQSFVFRGHEVLVAYAKYLIEYLDGRFAEDAAPFIHRRRH